MSITIDRLSGNSITIPITGQNRFNQIRSLIEDHINPQLFYRILDKDNQIVLSNCTEYNQNIDIEINGKYNLVLFNFRHELVENVKNFFKDEHTRYIESGSRNTFKHDLMMRMRHPGYIATELGFTLEDKQNVALFAYLIKNVNPWAFTFAHISGYEKPPFIVDFSLITAADNEELALSVIDTCSIMGVSNKLSNNPDFIIKALLKANEFETSETINYSIINHMDYKLRSNKEFILKAIPIYPDIINHREISLELKSDPEILELIKKQMDIVHRNKYFKYKKKYLENKKKSLK
jgi:hypothetical protein